MRIRREAEEALGDRFDIKGFHDRPWFSLVPLETLDRMIKDVGVPVTGAGWPCSPLGASFSWLRRSCPLRSTGKKSWCNARDWVASVQTR